MFKEQLHESFDAISPSPELLDRISAMMSEEASRPKPSIKMNAVRYGGIAAALALAAGGTFIVLNNANGSIGTMNKTSEAAVAETAAAGAAMDSFDGISAAAPEAYGMETTAGAAAAEEAAEAENYAINAVDADGGSFAGDELKADGNESDEPDEQKPEEQQPENTEPVNQMKIMSDDASLFSVTTTAARTEAATTAVPAAGDIDAGADRNNEADSEEYDECADEAPMPDDEPAEPNFDDAAFIASAVPDSNSLSGGTIEWADPASGYSSLEYEEPFIPLFYNIPLKLQVLAEGVVVQTEEGYVVGERWHDYVHSFPKNEYDRYEYTEDGDVIPTSADDMSGYREVTGGDEWINTYSFIKYFKLTDADVRAGLAGIYTDEQTEILLSGDKAKINAEFASDYAIVKGEKIYPPLWLDRHSPDEWKKAGITKKDIREKYEKLTHLPDYSEIIQKRLTEKLDEFLK